MSEGRRSLEIESPADLAVVEATARQRLSLNGPASQAPTVLTVDDVKQAKTHKPAMLVEKILPAQGATLDSAPSKTGKTLKNLQIGMSVATGHPVFDHYPVVTPGPVLFIEKDDPGGLASIQETVKRTELPMEGAPFYTVTDLDMTMGPDFILWLEHEIQTRKLRLVVLDSYTALREIHGHGGDLVKREHVDMTRLDELAKKHGMAIVVIHHYSKGSVHHDWSERAAGTYAMTAATEAQSVMARFPDLATNAPERLVRVRGRHFEGVDMVLRLDTDTLAFEHVLEGMAASHYADLFQLRRAFGTDTFSPKSVAEELGTARATAHRLIARLLAASAIRKTGYGEYLLEAF